LLQGLLGRTHDAGAAVLKRLLTLKGEGLPPGAGREAVVGWLAGVAAACEGRLEGGELQALQSAARWVGPGAGRGFWGGLEGLEGKSCRPCSLRPGGWAQGPAEFCWGGWRGKSCRLCTRHGG